MCAVRVGFGRRGGSIFSKASNFPEVPTVRIQGEVSQVWHWNRCWMRLGQQRGALAGGRRAPCSTPGCSFLLLSPSPASSPFLMLVELFAQWHGEPGWWLDPDGKKKWKKVFVCLYFHVDRLSSVVYHVATNTWKSMVKRLVQGREQVSGEKVGQGLLKLSWYWRWCHKPCYPNTEDVAFTRIWRCVSELIFFPASWDTLCWFHWRCVWQHKREHLVKSWSWLKLTTLCVKLC